MNDSKGQVALEYLLIFAVSLIILVIFTLPLTELTIQNTLDVSDTLLSKNCKVNVESNYISCNLKLHDGKSKSEKIYFKSTLEKSALYLKKGENSIVIEWPENSENMQIFVR